MKRIGALTFGILCLTASAVNATDGDQSLSLESIKASINETKRGNSLPASAIVGQPVQWVTIPGGKFKMGTKNVPDDTSNGAPTKPYPILDPADSKPIHEVSIQTFKMSKTMVTVEQYAECVTRGQCAKPDTGGRECNWGKAGRQQHPINCVSWDHANQFARFKGARLPSESEWEYAATSGGKNQKYPWGNEEATCEKAVMVGYGGFGCGNGSTMPVCSKPAGNTAQGLCDMAGNVWQWVQDEYRNSYADAPTDGSAFKTPSHQGIPSPRVVRGGSFFSEYAAFLRADLRYFSDPVSRTVTVGFRLVSR